MKFTTVSAGQNAATNQRESESNKGLSVFLETTSAKVGQIVRIHGVVKNPIGNLQLTIWVKFHGTCHQAIASAKIQGGQIIAEWRVTPFKSGTFTSGNYDVEIIYGGLVGKTSLPLRIATAGYNPNVSSFG